MNEPACPNPEPPPAGTPVRFRRKGAWYSGLAGTVAGAFAEPRPWDERRPREPFGHMAWVSVNHEGHRVRVPAWTSEIEVIR